MMGMGFCLMVLTIGWLSEPPLAADLLEKSMAYHDPDGAWASFSQTLKIRETRPGGTDRQIWMTLDLGEERFVYDRRVGEEHLVKALEKSTCQASLNGSAAISETDAERLRTDCASIRRLHHYYLYLYGLPMKLRDEGTQLAPQAKAATFMGQEVWSLKVTYSEDVGSDIWYFYFDRESAALVGCRFYHDESKGDGEYIVFENTYTLGTMKIPQNRIWYTNKEDRLLGTDHLEGHRQPEL